MEGLVVETLGDSKVSNSLLLVSDSSTILFDIVFKFVRGWRVERLRSLGSFLLKYRSAFLISDASSLLIALLTRCLVIDKSMNPLSGDYSFAANEGKAMP